jgi:hypothetical protein
VRQEAGEQLLGQRLLPGASGLDERQGTGQDGYVACAHAGFVIVQRQFPAADDGVP